ncbi:uncharacterized protein A4U43_C06F1360 [Asparagus officinalis]|uniref:Uncharacterized protein n=1 Tax=Asparagus officinalis TaxID=4686 RepID=A0A5P1EIP1_ASPOF|nr:uncharacterized protein C6orf136 homolog [Asparagus officinalis]ONK65825.1 uncharacterized protein A4U43_C06F1360 [Asparagus officinalis]
MSFLLPKISPPPPLLPNPKSSSQNALPRFHTYSSPSSPPSPLTDLELPAPAQDKEKRRRDDFYLNVGIAVRTLREDVPALFHKDLDYDIYREDITFIDPLNTFQGIENYRLILWALRFHGRVLFKEIGIGVFRVWQPSENSILIRWELQGVPRVPWETQGRFQGTSRYKLDRRGKVYEHKVDNLAFNFPRTVMKPVTVLDLVGAACPTTSPNLSFWEDQLGDSSARPWVELYRAVRLTLEQGEQGLGSVHKKLSDGLIVCS